MKNSPTISDVDLRTLAQMLSEHRADVPDHGYPPSLLGDLMEQIHCDMLSVAGFDSRREAWWLTQTGDGGEPEPDEDDRVHWQHYWDCAPCSYPDRTADLRSVVTVPDFYSARQWHSTGMFGEYFRPRGIEHELMLSMPAEPAGAAGCGRTLRVILFRGPGLGFSERDRALLTLLRPHLYEAYLDAERRRRPTPELTPRQWQLLHLLAAGHTNFQIARRLGVSEGTVRKHLENIYRRLDASNRMAAVRRAFPDRALG